MVKGDDAVKPDEKSKKKKRIFFKDNDILRLILISSSF